MVFDDDYHLGRRLYQKKLDRRVASLIKKLGISDPEARAIIREEKKQKKLAEWAEKVKQWREEEKADREKE